MKQGSLLGPAPTGAGTIASDPTFESFTLLITLCVTLYIYIMLRIWGYSWNSIRESDLIEFISQFSEQRCESY